MRGFRAAAVQIAVKPNDVEANLQKVAESLKRAKLEHEAELVVFPESVTTGFNPGLPVEALYELAEDIPGKATKLVGEISKELGVHVVLPVYERGPSPAVVYNSAVLINAKGEVQGVYRKTHPFPSERLSNAGWTTPGNRAPVFYTELGTLGIMICYDGDFPELARSMAVQGAEVIIRPAAFLRSFDIWYITNCARAYDNHVYVVACNAVGGDAGGNFYFGHSMIVSPIAERLAQARGTEEIVSAYLDPMPLKYITWGSKAPMTFDHLADRNLEAYVGVLQPASSPFKK